MSATIASVVTSLSWNPSIGLLTSDPQDLFTQVTYGNLSQVFVQAVGKPAGKVSIGAVYSSQVTCF